MRDLTAITQGLLRAHLSQRAETIARQAILDTCAVILAGRKARQAVLVRQMQEATGAHSQADRALWLGTAAHAQDFDDYEDVGSTHPSACIVAALLAVSDGRMMSIGQMLTAYVQGYETILTFGAAMGHAHYLAGWHATGTLGGLGAAAAVAHVLDLSPQGTATAISMAATMASGLKRQIGTDTKALHCGLAARTGVEAGYLAQAGLTAQTDIVTGAGGFLEMFSGQSDAWPGTASPRIEDHEPYVKPWPCCAYSHRTIEAAETLATQVDPSQIVAVTLDMPKPYNDVSGLRAPKCEAEARFSASFCAASTLVDGHLTPASFAETALLRPKLRQLEAMIDVRPYPLPPGVGDMSADAPDTLSLTLQNGRRVSQSVAETRGSPAKPLSPDDLVNKLVICGGDAAVARLFLASPTTAPFDAPVRMA